MRCPNPKCKREVRDGTTFCDHCGTQSVRFSRSLPVYHPCPIRRGSVRIAGTGPSSRSTATATFATLRCPNSATNQCQSQVWRLLLRPTLTVLTVQPGGFRLQLDPMTEYYVGRSDTPTTWSPAIDLEPFGGRDAGISRETLRSALCRRSLDNRRPGQPQWHRLAAASARCSRTRRTRCPTMQYLQLGGFAITLKAV